MKILYIEDDKLSGLAFKLNLSGHDTHVTHDSLMGIRLAHLCHYDFILINHRLVSQKINGNNLLRELQKNLFESSNPTFIAVAGKIEIFNQERILQNGFQHIMRKPAVYKELSLLIDSKKKSQDF